MGWKEEGKKGARRKVIAADKKKVGVSGGGVNGQEEAVIYVEVVPVESLENMEVEKLRGVGCRPRQTKQ